MPTRQIDREVALARSRRANAIKSEDPEAAAEAAADLDRAKRVAAIRRAARNAPPLTPEVLGEIVRTLAAAGACDA